MRKLLLLLLVAASLLAAFALLTAFVLASNRADRNETALRALCIQRDDLDARISASRKLLHHYAKSRLIFGIPRALIVSGLRQQVRTRHNLSILDCKE